MKTAYKLLGLALFVVVVAFVVVNVTVKIPVGATPGADFPYTCETHNGVMICSTKISMRTASSTLCSIKSPSATTTLDTARAIFTSTPSYATVYELGWAASAFATTTALGTTEFSIAASNQAVLIGSTTSAILGQSGVIPPNTYVNLKLSTTTASATFSPAGICTATFRGF